MRKLIIPAMVLLAIAAGCGEKPSPEEQLRDVPVTVPTETQAPPPARPGESEAPRPTEVAAPAKAADATAEAAAPRASGPAPAEPTPIAPPEVVGGALLEVNGQYFTIDDILTAAALELARIPPTLPAETFRNNAEQIIAATTRRHVQQVLVLGEADRVLSDEQKAMVDAEVNAALEDMIVRAGGSKKKLELDFASRGTTLQNVLDSYRKDLTTRSYLRMKFIPSVSISRSMLWDYYNKHRREFAKPAKVRMQIIFVPTAAFLSGGAGEPKAEELAAAKAAAKERIEQARAELSEGKDFAEVAKTYSQGIKAAEGGLWPPMSAGSFRYEQVEKAAFSQDVGKVSETIETDDGYFIVKTADVQAGSAVSFEDAQGQIEQILRDEQLAKMYDEYYKKLLTGATISQSPNFPAAAVERAMARYRGK